MKTLSLLITIEEDKQFLQLQREGRIGYMGQEGTTLSSPEFEWPRERLLLLNEGPKKTLEKRNQKLLVTQLCRVTVTEIILMKHNKNVESICS